MYLQYFGLKSIPFSLTPDPRFLYYTPSHREVLANLQYGIQHGKGLIVATGEVGTGKTTIIRAIMSRLDRSVLTSNIVNPGLSVDEFYDNIAGDFAIDAHKSKSDLLIRLGKMLAVRHSRGLRTVLIVDEAQGLSRELLEEIRLLLNFETDTEKQLQIILSGQPELREKLNHPGLRQLKQRISLRCEIKPLKSDEVSGYLRKRLKVAGAARFDLFTSDAIDLIGRASEGIPRLINNICDNALVSGYAMHKKLITAGIVSDVCESLDLAPPPLHAGAADAAPVLSINADQLDDWWEEEEHPAESKVSEIKPVRRRSAGRFNKRD